MCTDLHQVVILRKGHPRSIMRASLTIHINPQYETHHPQLSISPRKITTMMKASRKQQFLAKDSKSELGKRSGETVVEERACGSWYSWAAAKRWEMCFVWGAAPRGTIYWERDQQDNKFLSLYAHAWKITKVDNERNPNVERNTEYRIFLQQNKSLAPAPLGPRVGTIQRHQA